MSVAVPRPVAVRAGALELDARWQRPRRARAAMVLAHGAGAGMTHPFMEGMASALANEGIATLRFRFPYQQLGRRVPDRPPVLVAAIRAAVARARALARGLPLLAGGKSMGGRMAAVAQAEEPLAGVRALVFLGYPLHAAGRPSLARAAPLAALRVPLLFVQGGRDRLADPGLMRQVVAGLGARATLLELPQADHGFAVPKRSGETARCVQATIARGVAGWLREQGITERGDAR